jgi:hypothetical protein
MSALSQRFANQLKMVDKDAAVIAAADDAYCFVDWINCSRSMIHDPRFVVRAHWSPARERIIIKMMIVKQAH